MIGLEALLVLAGIVLLIIGHAVLGFILLGVGLVIVAVELLIALVIGKSVFATWHHFRKPRMS